MANLYDLKTPAYLEQFWVAKPEDADVGLSSELVFSKIKAELEGRAWDPAIACPLAWARKQTAEARLSEFLRFKLGQRTKKLAQKFKTEGTCLTKAQRRAVSQRSKAIKARVKQVMAQAEKDREVLIASQKSLEAGMTLKRFQASEQAWQGQWERYDKRDSKGRFCK